MPIFILLFAVQFVSLLMMALSIKRLYAYIRLYRFDESVYTLLFGFLHLRYFVALYVATVLLAILVETIYAFSLLSS